MTAAEIGYSVKGKAYSLEDKRNSIFKFVLSFILVTCYLLLTAAKPSFAQTPSAPPTYIAPTTNQYISGQSPHAASLAIYNFGHAMSCILIGQSPIAPCLEYRMVKDATGAVRSVPYLSQVNTSNGVLGMSLSMIGEVIGNPPIRSSEFLANFGEQIGIKSAHAQVSGSGSGVLAPIFKLWEVSRNISYLAMILIFIIVGLMVMFRQKLNPQTVVSIQMALPGLVIGLIMITFSYFLASLISDMAFVGTNIVGYYFTLAQGSTTAPSGLIDPTTNKEQNVLSIFSQYSNILKKGELEKVLTDIWPYLENKKLTGLFDIDASRALSIFAGLTLTQFIMPFGGALRGFGQFVSGVSGAWTVVDPIGTTSLALSFVAAIVLIYSMFKLLLRLIQNLLSIIFLTIAAPFYFLAASIPGRQSLVTNWAFNMLCNTLAFPAVFGVFYFVAFILGSQQPNPLFSITASSATISTGPTFPLLGGLPLNFLTNLLAFGALVASPSIPDIICRAVGKPGQLGALAAGAVGGAMAAGQRYQGQVQSGGSGLAGGVGPLTNKRGMFFDPGTNKFRTPETALEAFSAGTEPGQLTRFIGGAVSKIGLGRQEDPTNPGEKKWGVQGGILGGGRTALKWIDNKRPKRT